MSAPVLVVGGGPVGLTVANLLAARDVPVLLVERNAATSDEAKAISLDDESLRTYQSAGIEGDVLDIVVPGTGTRFYGRRGRALFHARGPAPYRLGFSFKNQFAQPELERVLLQALKDRPEVEVRFATELVGLHEQHDGMIAQLDSGEVAVSWVLGCDGGRSAVRELNGIGMTGTSHNDVWLVTDTIGDAHDERYGMHHGDPRRPTVIVPGRDGRCRYEFQLRPGEGSRGETPDFATIQRLLAPYRDIAPEQVERAVTYTFNAVIADRWREGRCLLLGDAAHMMPPFAGQGLNSGVRDAANVAWKLAEVWHGRAGEELLDTYEAERRPHATAMVHFSERLGDIVMTTSTARAFLRDLAIRVMLRTGSGRRYLSQMRFRPQAAHTAGVVAATGHPRTGTLLAQPRVLVPPSLRPCLLDDVLGPGMALLGVDVPSWDSTLSWRARPIEVVLGDRLPRPSAGRLAIADCDGALESAVGDMRGHFVLVKPDRYIAAVFTPDQATQVAAVLSDYM
ncbi:bifunctional 3-(3-hydroxy-phenyl)propionate/3-hydroxycinnamic acid hydroxylase [Nonomuraea lactucae]|uniref:bifunctional 3-(3-hydroxy-phenyl)propionate/3-hydroxycinnamic acid hydroxylase n=1 Tax=Nonomuraea lactucae TaxID=2249762 RepID=UPI000DE39C93|nr:bifunctional 3-(3-hydroxy-phenyl)propionate/3-hydroxycinnamic acid hydroxylase [Nonomuraea lactucae]